MTSSLYTAIQPRPVNTDSRPSPGPSSSGRFHAALKAEQARTGAAENGPEAASSPVYLGRLSSQNPTVSHLLVRNAEHASECWSIVHDAANRSKPFRQLKPGQEVWLNPATQEIILEQPSSRTAPAQEAGTAEDLGLSAVANRSTQENESGHPAASLDPEKQSAAQDHALRPSPEAFLSPAFSFTDPTLEDKAQAETSASASLSQAVAAYRGQPYSSLDCYELVVQGLKDLGVQYSGRQGLQNALIQEAKSNNLPLNALLTGEGLISSLGRPVAQTSLTPHTSDVRQQAEEMLASWQNRLEPGMIVSFSTPSRGHTGVLSSHQDKWTFINSGQIDNSIHADENGQQVGEEDLLQELENWIQRAAEENSRLQVTIGRLEQEKLAAYQAPSRRRA